MRSAFDVGDAMEVPSPPTSPLSSTRQASSSVRARSGGSRRGVEWADGVLGVGAVVTDGLSDWSVGAVPGGPVASCGFEVSRLGDALVVRAGIEGEALRLVRVAPFPADARAGSNCRERGSV